MTTYGATLLGARLLAIFIVASGLRRFIQEAAYPIDTWLRDGWAFDLVAMASVAAPAAFMLSGFVVWRWAPHLASSLDIHLLRDGIDDAVPEPPDGVPRHRAGLTSAAVLGVGLVGLFQVVSSLPGFVYGVPDLVFLLFEDPSPSTDIFGNRDFEDRFRRQGILNAVASIFGLGVGVAVLVKRGRLGAWILRAESVSDAGVADLEEEDLD